MRRHLTGLALVLLLGVLPTCGKTIGDGIATAGGAQPNATTSAQPTGADNRKFVECMRENGVDVPDPDPETGRIRIGGADDANRAAFQKAAESCRHLMPNGGVRPTLDPGQIEQLRVFAQCMRDNGVDMPDPDPNGGGLGLGPGAGGGRNPQLDRDNPTFQKAMKACEGKLPQFRGGRG